MLEDYLKKTEPEFYPPVENLLDLIYEHYTENKTRNPEEIISQRAIKLKDIRCCRDLLGYYTVMLNCEYIGINPNCTDGNLLRS